MRTTAISRSLLLIVAALGARTAAASPPNFEQWHFADHYALAIIRAGTENNEQALLAIERKAQGDQSPDARAYVFLAKAFRERMHLRSSSADKLATQCMVAAKNATSDAALALCGWLRMNLAARDGDYSRVARIAADIASANQRLMRLAGLTERDVEDNPELLFLRPPSDFVDLQAIEETGEDAPRGGSERIPITIDKDGAPWVRVMISGTPVDFMLDTGEPTTIISKAMAAKLHLESSRYKYWLSGLSNHASTYSEAFVKTFTVGAHALHNFNVLIDDAPNSDSILGMDFLLRMGRFSIGRKVLTFNPNNDSSCKKPARFYPGKFYQVIFPRPPRVGIETDSNFGRIYGFLDTGANFYAAADWREKRAFGINPKGPTEFHGVKLTTLAAYQEVSFYVPQSITLNVRGRKFRRSVFFFTNLNLPLRLDLGFRTTSDFSYYFDMAKGVACMRPVHGSSS